MFKIEGADDANKDTGDHVGYTRCHGSDVGVWPSQNSFHGLTGHAS
jgi:hypothetical protein